jgi:hypothetical protein
MAYLLLSSVTVMITKMTYIILNAKFVGEKVPKQSM